MRSTLIAGHGGPAGHVRSVHTSPPCFGLAITMGIVVERPLWEPGSCCHSESQKRTRSPLSPSSSMVNLWSPERVDSGAAGNVLSFAVTAAGFLGTGLGTLGTLCQEQLVTDQAKKNPLSSVLQGEFAPSPSLPSPSLPSPSLSFMDPLKSEAGTSENIPVVSTLTLLSNPFVSPKNT